MTKENYNVIGVMSGTSLDGVDLAHIFFEKDGPNWRFRLGVCQTIAYTDHWVSQLQSAVDFDQAALQKLNEDYTQLLGGIIRDFIHQNRLQPDAVCSHGHTILHQPQHGFTLQIGNLPDIAKITGFATVCDFRVQDVELGGQGAPLVPIGDRLLFADYDYCLNLGGFSNVSFEQNGKRIAFDISPVNTVLNHYARVLGQPYDAGGAMAATAHCDPELLDALNALDFYQQPFPKSLGFEYVKQTVLPLMAHFDIPPAVALHTFCEHVALQVARALPYTNGQLLVTGGGAYNDFLIGRLRHHLPQLQITVPEAKTLEFKEALIFGLLGLLRLRSEVNVLSSVTGARHDHSSGQVFQP